MLSSEAGDKETPEVVELRRYQRTAVDVAVEFVAKGSLERSPGRAGDLSLGGMYVQTPSPLPFGSELVVHVLLPGQKAPFALPAIVRWVRAGEGMGVQFGLLGARETHAITELTSRAP
jgi:type IV pilus assembly protein PilZ